VIQTALIVHAMIALQIQGWNWIYTLFYVFSFSQLFMNMYLMAGVKKAHFYGSVYGEVIFTPVMLMRLLLCLSIPILFWYAKAKVYAFIYEPEFYLKL